MSTVLAEPLELPCGRVIKNRFFKSAMSEIMGTVDHQPGKDLAKLYRSWAKGQSGLLITGNVMVDHKALGEPRNVAFDEKTDISKVKVWAKAATEYDADCWVQLNHPGKQAPNLINPDPVAPSAIPFSKGYDKLFNKPRALEEDEIWEIINRFANAARISKEAGFTGVQIHGAHGYLVSQFLSPLHNQREDKWGGSLTNRMRFVKEIYLAIRKEVGDDFPVGIKLNSADFQHGGFTQEESIKVIQKLDSMGVDLFEVSGGSYEAPAFVLEEHDRIREAYFIDFAAKVRKMIKAPMVATGGFRTVSIMEKAISSGDVDMVGLGRPLTLQPDLPKRIMRGWRVRNLVKPLSTGIKALDKVGMLEITWYEQQMARIAKGKKPAPKMSVYLSLLRALGNNGLQAFQQRRA